MCFVDVGVQEAADKIPALQKGITEQQDGGGTFQEVVTMSMSKAE